MPKIRFQAKLTAVGSQAILRLPEAASSKLPSRGMSMVEGTLNGDAFRVPLEPDGLGSHWFRVSNTMLRAAGAEVGDSVSVAVEPMALWPEPKLPADSMHRPFDVAQGRASRTNARYRKVRGAAGKIEKNLTHSMLAVSSVRIPFR